MIEFSLPRAADVSLRLYDVTGREAATLLNEPMNAGTHSLGFEANALPSGVYFVRLIADGLTASHKLLLLK